MRYVGIKNKDVIIAKAKLYTDFVDKRQIELTEEQYNTIPLPCKLVNGKFVPCEYPKVTVPEIKPEPTQAEDIDTMLIDHEYRLTLLELGV